MVGIILTAVHVSPVILTAVSIVKNKQKTMYAYYMM